MRTTLTIALLAAAVAATGSLVVGPKPIALAQTEPPPVSLPLYVPQYERGPRIIHIPQRPGAEVEPATPEEPTAAIDNPPMEKVAPVKRATTEVAPVARITPPETKLAPPLTKMARPERIAQVEKPKPRPKPRRVAAKTHHDVAPKKPQRHTAAPPPPLPPHSHSPRTVLATPPPPPPGPPRSVMSAPPPPAVGPTPTHPTLHFDEGEKFGQPVAPLSAPIPPIND